MKVLTLRLRTNLTMQDGPHYSEIPINPGTRIVMNDQAAIALINPTSTENLVQSYWDINRYMSKPLPTDWHGANVLFMRKRGIGDELIMTGAVRYFSQVLKSNCYVLCKPSHEGVWYNNDTVVSLLAEPLYLDAIYRKDSKPFFDHAFLLEYFTEGDPESSYDAFYQTAALEAHEVDAQYKRPYLRLSADDLDAFREWTISVPVDLSSGYIVHQLSTTKSTRDVPEHIELEILKALERAPRPVIAMDDKASSPAIADFIAQSDNIINAGMIRTLRLYFTIISQAAVVIGPDSSAIHVAAAFDVPSIAFWGQVAPTSRTRYYKNHYPIWHRKNCRHSPCHSFLAKLPAAMCPKGEDQKYCECFSDITQEEISEALNRVLS
jgi:hypothetical protein